ncbi:MAG: hypothetical protein ACTSQG_10945 [Promethearchaeota archaeon]
MNLELTTGVLGNTTPIENGWLNISILLFLFLCLTFWLLDRRIQEVKKLRAKIKNYEDNII